MKLNKRIQLLMIVIYLLFFGGCKEGPLQLSIRYDTLGELKSKVPVYFEKTEIGYVDKIVSTDNGDYLVEISIYPNHKDKATDNSKFFILDDPFDTDSKAIIVKQEPQGGKILQDRSIVQGEQFQGLWDEFVKGLKKSTQDATETIHESMQSLQKTISGNTHHLNEQLERSLDDVKNHLQGFSDSVDAALNSDDFKKLQTSLEGFIEEFKNSGKELQAFIKAEILPELQRSLEGLRDSLKQNGQDEEAEEIDHSIKELLAI